MHLRTLAFLLFNGLGIAWFLSLASAGRVKPRLFYESGVSFAGAAIYVIGAIPVLAGCLLFDVLWMVLEIEFSMKVPRGFGPAFLVVLPLWVAVVCVDLLHR